MNTQTTFQYEFHGARIFRKVPLMCLHLQQALGYVSFGTIS